MLLYKQTVVFALKKILYITILQFGVNYEDSAMYELLFRFRSLQIKKIKISFFFHSLRRYTVAIFGISLHQIFQVSN